MIVLNIFHIFLLPKERDEKRFIRDTYCLEVVFYLSINRQLLAPKTTRPLPIAPDFPKNWGDRHVSLA